MRHDLLRKRKIGDPQDGRSWSTARLWLVFIDHFLTSPPNPQCEESLWIYAIHSHQSAPHGVRTQISDAFDCPQQSWEMSVGLLI